MSTELVIGVDLGGTKIEAVIAERDRATAALRVVERRRVPTPREHGYDAVLAATRDLITDVASAAGASLEQVPIGVGMPGNVTRREGLVKNSNTICLNGKPFRADLSRALGRPLAFDNDANCFALAEATMGAAAAYRDGIVFGVIMGTGVGGGLVIKGSIWQGLSGIAGEWGHHAVYRTRPAAPTSSNLEHHFTALDRLCYCGECGCLELYASGPAVEDDYARRAGARLALADIAARRADDEHAAAAIEGLLDAFGRGLANVIDILDPSAIVLGGGVSNLTCLYDEGVARVAAYVFNDELVTPILQNTLGDSAGVLGAALITS